MGIDTSIRLQRKLLLILSPTSVQSARVEQEVETALERERKEKRPVLFPVRLDDTMMQIDSGWPAHIYCTRNTGDFRQWQHRDAFQKILKRLFRDLTADDKPSTQP